MKEYLVRKGLTEAQVPGTDIRAVAEDQSTSKTMEDPTDRAVRLTVAVGIKPFPIHPSIIVPVIITEPPVIAVPPVIIAGDKPEGRWTIREIFGMHGNAGVGAGIPGVGVGVDAGGCQYAFLLVDRKTGRMSKCTFAGPAVSVGIGPSTKRSGPLSAGLSITGQSKT